MAIIYLNRGLILEQAIRDIVQGYYRALHIDRMYPALTVGVEVTHPFARLYGEANTPGNIQNSFPAVVVSSIDDTKPEEFRQLAPHIDKVTIGSDALEGSPDSILTTTRNIDGKKYPIPGLCTIASDTDIATLRAAIASRGKVAAISARVRRHETIGLEVWDTNNQRKNELYEALRLFTLCSLEGILREVYPFFDISIFDHSIRGQRGGTYNMDFSVPLYGASITLEASYMLEEIVVDTAGDALYPTVIDDIIAKANNL